MNVGLQPLAVGVWETHGSLRCEKDNESSSQKHRLLLQLPVYVKTLMERRPKNLRKLVFGRLLMSHGSFSLHFSAWVVKVGVWNLQSHGCVCCHFVHVGLYRWHKQGWNVWLKHWILNEPTVTALHWQTKTKTKKMIQHSWVLRRLKLKQKKKKKKSASFVWILIEQPSEACRWKYFNIFHFFRPTCLLGSVPL